MKELRILHVFNTLKTHLITHDIARIGLRQRGSHWESLDFVSQRRFEMMIGAERSAAVRRIANNGAYKGSLHSTLLSQRFLRRADGWWVDLLATGAGEVHGCVIHVHCQSSRRKGDSCNRPRPLEPPECFSASDETFATSYESREEK